MNDKERERIVREVVAIADTLPYRDALRKTLELAIPDDAMVVKRAKYLGMQSALMQAGCMYGGGVADVDCDCPACCALSGRRIPGTCRVCAADISLCICSGDTDA